MNIIPFQRFTLLIIALCFMQACGNKQRVEVTKLNLSDEVYDTAYSVNTKGYDQSGQIITSFDCPDSRFFPPIDIKEWNKTRVVNGRLPTYKETLNGMAILTYGGKTNPRFKPYNMILPKLAYCATGQTKLVFDSKTGKEIRIHEPVVVIQIVQTANDTIVGYRYLSGGCGGSSYYNFHFLTDEEVKQEVEQKNDWNSDYKKL